jgi:hypothetical protein
MYYSFLKDEFRKKKDPNALKPYQLYELKKVREALKTGNLPRGGWLDDAPIQGPCTQPTAEFKQNDLVWKIHQNFRQLKGLLQEENLYLYNLEHNCEPYGAVDMVYMGKNTVYPVEVKKDRGDHALVGQISKYDLYHRFRLHYRHYNFVQSATICSSYDNFTLRELKRLKVKPIVYSIIDDRLSLKML